jgi:hypothetical protein
MKGRFRVFGMKNCIFGEKKRLKTVGKYAE